MLVCNGIGPARGRGFAVNVAWALSSAVLFLLDDWRDFYCSAGEDHDLHYALGGTWRDKRLADGVFCAQLFDLAREVPLPRRLVAWAVATAFSLSVRVGGWWSFRYRPMGPVTLRQLEAEVCE